MFCSDVHLRSNLWSVHVSTHSNVMSFHWSFTWSPWSILHEQLQEVDDYSFFLSFFLSLFLSFFLCVFVSLFVLHGHEQQTT